jgi:hypothetical protein
MTATELGRFSAHQIEGGRRYGHTFDDHIGEWVVSEGGYNVGIFPSLKAAAQWAAQQPASPVEQVAIEVARQDIGSWELESPEALLALYNALPAAARSRYIDRAERLVRAYRYVPLQPGYENDLIR